MLSKQFYLLALVVALLCQQPLLLTEARSTGRSSSTSTTDTVTASDEEEASLDAECVISIVNSLFTSFNNFVTDFGVGVIPCGFTSCAPDPITGTVFVADCIACITSAIPFFGPVPENVCS